MSDYDYKDGGFVNEAEENQYIKDLNMNKQPKQYNNTNPPYLNKDWQYNQYNSILDRFKAMGWVAPSEQKGTK
jgi:hypothetical protein